jgi:8-oxo-dGTP diphosphatase
MIEAAGGLVWRVVDDGHVEVVVIIQSGRTGWSLPKGKLRRDEDALVAALREVREETGLRCAAGDEIATTTYLDRKGRDKRVRYWAMYVVSGRLRPNAEVDEVRWVGVDDAAAMLVDAHDVEVLHSLHEAIAGARSA